MIYVNVRIWGVTDMDIEYEVDSIIDKDPAHSHTTSLPYHLECIVTVRLGPMTGPIYL